MHDWQPEDRVYLTPAALTRAGLIQCDGPLEPTAHERQGMAWWNGLTHGQRLEALAAVGGNASPADAYARHLHALLQEA